MQIIIVVFFLESFSIADTMYQRINYDVLYKCTKRAQFSHITHSYRVTCIVNAIRHILAQAKTFLSCIQGFRNKLIQHIQDIFDIFINAKLLLLLLLKIIK